MFIPHHVPHVMCHKSGVRCQVSGVKFFLFFFGQRGGASRLRVCYQRGLPPLVHMQMPNEPLLSPLHVDVVVKLCLQVIDPVLQGLVDSMKKDFREGDKHAEGHPDINNLHIRGGR